MRSLQRANPRYPAAGNGTSTLVTLAMIAIVVAALYFGADIFVPLALATLLSFALAPLVRWLRRLRMPNLPAVLLVVTLAFLVIVAFASMIAWQAADLAERLPTYRQNIESKIETFFEEPPGGRLFSRAADMVRDLGRSIEREQEENAEPEPAPGEPEQEDAPLPVEIHEPPPTSIQIIRSVIGPLVGPLATAGIVIVFVIFMLLEREDLRNRFIRLAGARDLPRTTKAMDDAARRVGRFLLMQLVVNVTYAIPIGIGLWLIGIPNAALWAILCGVLRFAPYIGPIIAAFFPLALSVAVDPGWTTFMMAGALFIVVELGSNNFVEPLLYGASTGLSPIAVIAAAVFWTWLWGPIGLLLATPLTVCLVVLGRNVPQLAFLDVLLGNEPVLAPPEFLYQRLLVGDAAEATERAEEYLRDKPLISFYEDVAMPALALADDDRANGRLSDEQREQVAQGAMILVDNLEDLERPDANGATISEDALAGDEGQQQGDLPTLAGRRIVCAGARGNLDDAAAAILAHLLEQQGAETALVTHEEMQSPRLQSPELGDPDIVALSYMNAESLAHARYLTRRIRRQFPDAKVVAGFWMLAPEDMERRDPLAATRVDHVATSLAEAIGDITRALTEHDTPPARNEAVVAG